MIKVIQAKDIKKINRLIIEIFELEDDFFVDRRQIAPKERTIQNILNRITKDEKEQELIFKAIEAETFNSDDYTFKPIVKNLKELGYEIIR